MHRPERAGVGRAPLALSRRAHRGRSLRRARGSRLVAASSATATRSWRRSRSSSRACAPAEKLARALLTVLFTDIVDATAHAARLGDGRWRDLLADHDGQVRAELGALRRTRGEDRRRRLPGDLRGPPLARAALRAGDHPRRPRARHRGACRRAHGRVRADRRGRGRHGSPHRLARQRARRRPARCSCRAPCSGRSWADRSPSRIAAFTSSRACPDRGRCSRSPPNAGKKCS